MIEGFLYDLVASRRLFEFREKLIENKNDNITKWVAEDRAAVEKALTSEQLKLVDKYIHSLNLNNEDIEISVDIKLLNYGIMIGMELQHAIEQE